MTELRGAASAPTRPAVRPWLLWAWGLAATGTLLVLWWLPRWALVPDSWWVALERPEPPPIRLVLERASFDDLPGFADDDVGEALPALRRSCVRHRFLGPDQVVTPEARGGRVADWAPFCEAILALPQQGTDRDRAVRRVLREQTVPLRVGDNRDGTGLFTGYYEPTLQGSLRRSDRYRHPLYRRPSDIVSVDLGAFREEFEGRSVAGRLVGNRLLPYHDRAAIEEGVLARRGLEVVWVDDPVDSFFLHIQGSGRVELAEGGVLRVGYAGQNGHPYYAIGRELVKREGMDPKDVSMQAIRSWLAENPEQATEVMNANASYVFFRTLDGEGPLGAQGVALVPGRSLAVDRAHHPLGAPVWLDATAPAADPGEADRVLRRLLVAQDTGGAIRGPVRGDVFWGGGDEAAEIAGRMQHSGRMWILLPTALADRVLAEQATEPAEAG